MAKIAPEISTEWLSFAQLSAAALYELLRFRQQIFVVEQTSPYPDLDGLDEQARHLVLRDEGRTVGYLRLVTLPEAWKIGRVAVAAERRRDGLGRRLVAEALAFCQICNPGQPVLVGAQHRLLRFYESFGFRTVSQPYDDFGVPHIDMRRPPG